MYVYIYTYIYILYTYTHFSIRFAMENLPPAVDPRLLEDLSLGQVAGAAQQHSQRHRCRGNAPKCVGLRMSWNSLFFSTVGLVAGSKKKHHFSGTKVIYIMVHQKLFGSR